MDRVNIEILFFFFGLEGVSYYEDLKKDYIVFSLPLSNLKKIRTPTNYSLKNLVVDTSLMGEKDLFDSFNNIIKGISLIQTCVEQQTNSTSKYSRLIWQN